MVRSLVGERATDESERRSRRAEYRGSARWSRDRLTKRTDERCPLRTKQTQPHASARWGGLTDGSSRGSSRKTERHYLMGRSTPKSPSPEASGAVGLSGARGRLSAIGLMGARPVVKQGTHSAPSERGVQPVVVPWRLDQQWTEQELRYSRSIRGKFVSRIRSWSLYGH